MTLLVVAALVFVGLLGWVVLFGAPYVPVKITHVKKAFDDVYRLRPSDVLVDLGSGDGKVLREAARRGARAIGYEINPMLVMISRLLERTQPRATTQLANMWRAPLPQETTIIYVFTESRDVRRLAQRMQREATRLKKPLHVLSYGFEMPLGKEVGRNDNHFLYRFTPLQSKKAQV